MLHHTVEPSSPFVGESFCAFCLCNFIVALLLLLSLGRRTAAVGVYDELKEAVCNEDDEEPEKPEKPKKATIARDEMEVITKDVKKKDNVEEDEEDDDELMRKAEEFIQRMVKTWKVEKQIQRSHLLLSN
ncbi:hypothetical protein IEQ34_026936 [Dendrobium chrysotoxum]|uniref:Uncharacterized protein n=1 Tax=Dendrobium chrysotoxum TaxID=161865 RepID=A0AAV7FL55_DENCH|nr:hypothetical protein IEQ34_026936 [Dendrobium chrysotoxum]